MMEMCDVLDTAEPKTLRRLTEVVVQVAMQHGLAPTFSPTDALVDKGMTSMAMVDLMLAVEAEFDLTIPQRDMTPANFQTILSLAAMVDRIAF